MPPKRKAIAKKKAAAPGASAKEEKGEAKPAAAAAKVAKKPAAATAAEAVVDAAVAAAVAEAEDGAAQEVADDAEDGTAEQAPSAEELKAAAKAGAKAASSAKAKRFDVLAEGAEAPGPEEPRGVIYIGHVPKGFFEPQMRQFFTQFGTVCRLRLSRSKKNAGFKGYGFIEFKEESVAKIVADTMNGYLLFGKKMECHLVPKEKQHPALWRNCKRKLPNLSHRRRRLAREVHNNRPTVEVDGESVPQVTQKQVKRRGRSQRKLQSLLTTLGVDYDVGEVSGRDAAAAKKEEKPKRKTPAPASSTGAAAASSELKGAAGAAASRAGKRRKTKA